MAGLSALVLAGCSGNGAPPPSPLTDPLGGTSTSLGPAQRIFDTLALQNGVKQVLTQSYGIASVGEVHCPSQQAVQTGISFDCTVELGGAMKAVTLTVKSSDGTYEVSQPK
jgi:hypothetical protein